MREYTNEVMADEMAVERSVEQVQDTCADTCDDSYADWARYLEPLWALPRDMEVMHYAVTKHGVQIHPGSDEYDYLVRKLKRGSDAERELAVEILGNIDDAAVLRLLEDVALHDENPKLRARALEIACARFGARALYTVCWALTSSHPLVWYTAERILLSMYRNADLAGRQRIFEYIVSKLRDMLHR